MKHYLPFILVFMLLACSKPSQVSQYQDGKQVLNMNNKMAYGEDLESVKLRIIHPDSIKVNTQAVFRIITTNQDFKLVNGLFDCEISSKSLIDTSTYKVDNCTKEFIVRNDTMFIAFKPPQVGLFDFPHEIIGISKDSLGILRYHKGKISYEVKE